MLSGIHYFITKFKTQIDVIILSRFKARTANTIFTLNILFNENIYNEIVLNYSGILALKPT